MKGWESRIGNRKSRERWRSALGSRLERLASSVVAFGTGAHLRASARPVDGCQVLFAALMGFKPVCVRGVCGCAMQVRYRPAPRKPMQARGRTTQSTARFTTAVPSHPASPRRRPQPWGQQIDQCFERAVHPDNAQQHGADAAEQKGQDEMGDEFVPWGRRFGMREWGFVTARATSIACRLSLPQSSRIC